MNSTSFGECVNVRGFIHKIAWDHYHKLQTSKPTTTSDSTPENCKRQLKMESRTHHTKGRPTCQSGYPVSPMGGPAGPLWSLFALRCLVCVSKIYTINFKSVLSQFIQWWSRELTQIDDVAMPCPLLYLPYIRHPLPLSLKPSWNPNSYPPHQDQSQLLRED